MKPAGGTLIAHLNSANVYQAADLLTITFWDASVIRLTNCDIELTVSGSVFSSARDNGTIATFKRGKTRMVAGLEVDQLDFTLFCGGTVQLGGVSMAKAALNGSFDGALVKLERIFMPTWGDTSYGTVILFEGSIAGIQPSSTKIQFTAKSMLEDLNVAMPRNCFTPSCMNRVYDLACGLNRATYTVSGTLDTVTNLTTVYDAALTQAADYFTLGTLVLNSGVCAGSRRAVKAFASGTVTLSVPLPALPSVGDSFSIYPGCSRTMAICQSKFSNQTRFRGTPFVPRPETAR